MVESASTSSRLHTPASHTARVVTLRCGVGERLVREPVGPEAPRPGVGDSAPDFIVSAVVLRDADGRILVVRKRGTSRYMLPGGKIEAGETPAQAAVRELFEEVGAELDPAHLTFLGEWTAPAANEPDHTVLGHIFEHPWIDGLSVRAEIEDLLLLHPDEMATRDDLAPLLVTRVLPALAPEVR